MSLTSLSSAPQFSSSVWPTLSELWVRAITHRVSRSGPVTQPTCPHSRVWILWIALTGMDGIRTPFRLDAGQRSTRITSGWEKKESPARTQLGFWQMLVWQQVWFQEQVGVCVICVGLTSGALHRRSGWCRQWLGIKISPFQGISSHSWS